MAVEFVYVPFLFPISRDPPEGGTLKAFERRLKQLGVSNF